MTSRDLQNIHPSIFTCWWRSLLAATCNFGLLTIRQHSATRKQLYPYPQGDRSGLRKQKKMININTSIHLPKRVSTDLTIKSDSVLTNRIGKDEVRGCSMQSNIYPMSCFLSWHHLEGWPTKAKEVPYPHVVRLTPLDKSVETHVYRIPKNLYRETYFFKLEQQN